MRDETFCALDLASSALSADAKATPMRRRLNEVGFPNNRKSDSGTVSALSIFSKRIPSAS